MEPNITFNDGIEEEILNCLYRNDLFNYIMNNKFSNITNVADVLENNASTYQGVKYWIDDITYTIEIESNEGSILLKYCNDKAWVTFNNMTAFHCSVGFPLRHDYPAHMENCICDTLVKDYFSNKVK